MPFCPYCGREVSDGATVCPHCGKGLGTRPPLVERQTRKRTSGLTIAGLVLGGIGSVLMVRAGIAMAAIDRWNAVAGDFYRDVGFGFIGLGIFFIGILCFLLDRWY
jgi:hypothetical protein